MSLLNQNRVKSIKYDAYYNAIIQLVTVFPRPKSQRRATNWTH